MLIFRQLLEELRKEGLARGRLGRRAVRSRAARGGVDDRASTALPPNTVVEEMQRGYLLHERLLRPALVKVTVEPAYEPFEPSGGTNAR